MIVDRDSGARSFASRQRRWKRWFGIDQHVPVERGEEQKPYIVMPDVICVVLGAAMIVIGGYWWVTSYDAVNTKFAE